jgi:arginyl-tRNA synthetase
MKFKINKSVFERFWDIVEVVPIITGFDASKNETKALDGLRAAEQTKHDQLWRDKLEFKQYIDTFIGFGAPEAWLPSHAALTARVMDGKQLPNINPVVNFYNSYSVKNTIPFGGENLSMVVGNMELTIANGGETWWGMGEKKNKPSFRGELIWKDDQSITCRAWNWRQCDRTKITEETKNAYFIMDGFENNREKLLETAQKFVEEFCKMFGGEGKIFVLDKNNPEIEIDFESKSENIPEGVEKNVVFKEKPKVDTYDPETVKQLKGWVGSVMSTNVNINIEHPIDNRFGDYTTNVAMLLSKELKKSAPEIANDIKNKLEGVVDKSVVEIIEVAGNGYINFYLKTDYLVKKIGGGITGRPGAGKTMVIDYSAPNIAKPFGIGHLRSTNIGQAIYNIYKTLGWKCIGDNHLGDWGTQFGKMIAALKYWGPENVEGLTIADLEKLYVKFHEEAEKNAILADEGREWFAKLEKKDPEARKIWQECVDISMREFNRVYDLLGVKIDYAHGEAFYEEMLPAVIKEMVDRGITKISNGATIVEFGDMAPAILVKSDGATTYFTRDMATIKWRIDNWRPDLSIYEVGSEQTLHFRQVFKAAEMMGWTKAGQLYHLPHGLIRWATGKFSTRKGDTIHLQDIIDKAMEEAGKIAPNNSNEQIRTVAIGAVKFTDLSSDPKKDVIFEWERMMDLQGDSGPYLQYTYARCQSVLAKTNKRYPINDIRYTNKNNEEIGLVRELYKFEEKVVEAAQRYNPSIIAEYLISVARKYNEFYGKYRIIGQPEEEWRLWLTQATAKTLKTGLGLLGIETVEKM